jgi:hypothetical protein
MHPTIGGCMASAGSEARNNSVALMGYKRGENALPVLVVLTTEKGIVKGKRTVGTCEV